MKTENRIAEAKASWQTAQAAHEALISGGAGQTELEESNQRAGMALAALAEARHEYLKHREDEAWREWWNIGIRA